jgi:hypothetical protein
MQLLENLIISGRIIDIMLAFLAIETLWLVWRRRRTGRGPTIAAIITNAGAGGSLMLALKAMYLGTAWPVLAAALLGSMFFHISDLMMRWRESPKPSTGAPS